ncbi:MAG: hypothetical protein ACRDJU_07410, partial [Actinomycetota bacterium]
ANTMSLQYLDALKQIGGSPSTKFVVPMELSGLLSSVTGLTGKAFGNGNGAAPAAAPPASPAAETPEAAENSVQ